MRTEVLQRFPEERPLSENLGHWLVACVKPRHEKALAHDLEAAGIPYYLPLGAKVHRRPDNGGAKKAIVPLFPGYMACAGLECRSFLYATGRVKRVLTVPDQEGFTRELQSVEKALNSGLKVQLHTYIPLGSPVVIAHGSMKGATGKLERIDKNLFLVICVEIFHRCVSVKLSPHDVKLQGQSHHSLQPLPASRINSTRPL